MLFSGKNVENWRNLQGKSLLVMALILLTLNTSYANSSKLISNLRSKNSLTPQLTAETKTTIEVKDPNLEMGKVIEQELEGGAFHSYTLQLKDSQYLNIVIQQKGIDIVATLYSPTNEKVYEIDSFNSTDGEEPIYFISQVAGSYRLEIRSLEKTTKAGKYEVKINELRASTSQDISRITGFKLFIEAEALKATKKQENLGRVAKELIN